jgi:hypothetical protein
MSSVDKEIASHEVGLDQSLQDDRDMERLGKSQQLKVSGSGRLGCGGAPQYDS